MTQEICTVHCETIDNIHLTFTCPFCWSSYKKDGTPKKTAKPVIHRHGSNGNFTNRTEHRIPHCTKDKSHTFNIVIDDQTIRKLFY